MTVATRADARDAVLAAINTAIERHINAKADAAFYRLPEMWRDADRALAVLERERRWTEGRK